MNALNDRFAFEAVMRESELVSALNLRNVDEALADLQTPRPPATSRMAALSILAGLGIMSAIIFVAGYSALLSDTPAVWVHRLMALTVAQSILIAAVAMKLLPLIERPHFTARIAPRTATTDINEREPEPEEPAPLPPPAPRQPSVGGQLAGREFLQFDDGSIEINTLVGRRRFVSIDAAREFVGA